MSYVRQGDVVASSATMVVEATVPRSSRSGGLREQEAEIERLSRENFNLKLRVYYLEERLSQRDGQKSGDPGDTAAGSRRGASAGVAAAAADIERECVELRVALAEERRSVREKDDLLRRAKESLATIREVSVSDRKRADDAAREQSGTSRELQDARNAADRAKQELSEIARPLHSVLSDLVTSAALCQTAERRLAEMGSSTSRSALHRSAIGGAAGKPGSSFATESAHGIAAETSERATQLRSAMERLAELATSARAAGNADSERLESLRSELRKAQDRAHEAEDEAAGIRAQLEAMNAAAMARDARHAGPTAYGSTYGAVGRSSRVIQPPRLGGGGGSSMSPDAAVLAAELERCVAELTSERAARAKLVRDAERHEDVLKEKESGTDLQAERCASLERRCDELTERLAASERSAAQNRGGSDDALRKARDAEAAAEERSSVALQRQRELSEEVARLSRRLAEAEVGWASATQLGEQAASDAARTKSQARQASAELYAAKHEAALLREASGEAKQREEASSRARAGRTAAQLRSARARLAAFRVALLGEGGILSDAAMPHRRKSHGARSARGGGTHADEAGDGEHQHARDDDEEDDAILHALAQLRPVMTWVREAVEAAEGRAERRVRDAESHIERLASRLETTEVALTEAVSRAARFRAATAASGSRSGGGGPGSEDLRAIEERSALLEEALQASATRGSALQESNRLLALELQEKAGRLQEVGRRGIAAAAAADALEGCIDRLGLIARETARTVSAASGPGAGSTRGAETVRSGVADLTQRVSSLASDTLEVLRQLTSPGE